MDNIQLHTLGIIAHSKLKSSKIEYELPIILQWDDEFCNALNSLEYDKKIKFKLIQQLNGSSNDKVISIFKKYHNIAPVKTIYIFQDLPVEFVRFTDTVILKTDAEGIAKKCLESIREGLSILNTFNETCNKILSGEEDKNIAHETITKICAIQAYFTADNKRPELGSDHDVINELLQNANDKISDGIMNISIDENKLILSYKEAIGFTLKDFMAISTMGNSGNIDGDGNHNGSTGKKGTGFKSVYNFFKKVEVESNNVKCTLDDTVYYEVNFKNNDCEIFESREYNDISERKTFPVPIFEKLDTSNEYTTKLTFTFIDNIDNSFFKNIFKEDFLTNNNKFYFLHNIKIFIINGIRLEKDKCITDNYYKYPNSNSNENKLDMEMLLPINNIEEFTGGLYVGLPVDDYKIFEGCKFYINIPSLELMDNRRNITDNTEKGITELKKVFRANFSNMFNNFIKYNAQIAYKYFPFNLLNGDLDDEDEGNLKSISFIYINWSSQNQSDSSYTKNLFISSINEWYSMHDDKHTEEQPNYCNEYQYQGFVFLPDFMYTNKLSHNFKDTAISFVCYDNERDSLALKERLQELNMSNPNIDSLVFRENEQKVGRIQLDIKSFLDNYFINDIRNVKCENEKNNKIDILKSISKDEEYNFKYKNIHIMHWYLGHSFCSENDFYDIDLKNGENEEEYIEYLDKKYHNAKYYINEFNNLTQIQIYFSEFDNGMKNLFPKIRTNLYLDRDRNIVDPADGFLNAILNKYSDNLAKIFEFNNEFNLINNDERIEQIKKLFDSGKIVVKVNKENYRLSAGKGFYYSNIITDKDYIVNKPEWAKNYVIDLDEELENGNLKKIYNDNSAIDCNEIFGKCMEKQWSWNWNDFYFQFLDMYNKYNKNNKNIKNNNLKFIFDNLSDLSNIIKGRCEDKIPTEILNKKFIFLDQHKSLQDIINNDVKIYSTDGTHNKNYWTLGKDNDAVDNPIKIVVFGEKAFGTMLKELFNCDNYIKPKQYNHMECKHPAPRGKFNKWTKIPIEKWESIFDSYLPSVQNQTDYEILKSRLVNRFTCIIDETKYIFKGYAGKKNTEQHCPVCGGRLLCELTSLHIKYVKVKTEEPNKNIYVPIILCSNCATAFSYAYDIYLDIPKIEDIRNEYIKLCFNMQGNVKKIIDVDMNFLHRVLIYREMINNNERNK